MKIKTLLQYGWPTCVVFDLNAKSLIENASYFNEGTFNEQPAIAQTQISLET